MEPLTTHLVLAADASIDLQLHTTYSDGEWTPEQLINYLVGEQFGLVAITDHERVDSVAPLQHLAAQKQLPVLAAVEMTTTWNGKTTDLLCYGFHLHQNEFHKLAGHLLLRQQEIRQEVYEHLLQKGYAFPKYQEVRKKSEREPLQVGELQILLEQHGYGINQETLRKIIFDAGYFYATNDMAVVIDAAHKSGAVCLIAHPGRRDRDLLCYDVALLDRLRQEIPIDGLEVYYPTHTPEQLAMYLGYAEKHNLLISSGSDSHGPGNKPIKYRADLSRRLLERVGIEVK